MNAIIVLFVPVVRTVSVQSVVAIVSDARMWRYALFAMIVLAVPLAMIVHIVSVKQTGVIGGKFTLIRARSPITIVGVQ